MIPIPEFDAQMDPVMQDAAVLAPPQQEQPNGDPIEEAVYEDINLNGDNISLEWDDSWNASFYELPIPSSKPPNPISNNNYQYISSM